MYRDFNAKVGIVALLLLILLLTYSTTQYQFTKSSKLEGTEPPQVPYLVPFLGNTYAYASNPAQLFRAITYAPRCAFAVHYSRFLIKEQERIP